jgi:hypothetical protein
LLTGRHDGMGRKRRAMGRFDLGTSPARFMKLPKSNFRNRQFGAGLV